MTSEPQFNTQEVEAALKKVWTNPACPFSGHREWALANEFVEVRPFHAGALVVGGNVYPAVMVACKGCGYMALFSAVQLGLVGKKEVARG